MMTREEYIRKQMDEIIRLRNWIIDTRSRLIMAANIIKYCFGVGGKLMLFGNGGSAADAQHIAAEFIGKGFPAISLAVDPSAVTALSNDFSYEFVFERQIAALFGIHDIAIGISTSGESENVIAGLKGARMRGLHTIAFIGDDASKVHGVAIDILGVPSQNTQRIQEMHITMGHLIWEMVCGMEEDE